VIAWAMDDPKLLRTLVKPHMVGITAHAIGRVASGKTQPEPVAQEAPASGAGYTSTGRTQQAAPKAKKKKESFGMDILKTIAGGKTAEFGQEDYNMPRRKQGVSQNHIDAIHAMIKKSSSE